MSGGHSCFHLFTLLLSPTYLYQWALPPSQAGLPLTCVHLLSWFKVLFLLLPSWLHHFWGDRAWWRFWGGKISCWCWGIIFFVWGLMFWTGSLPCVQFWLLPFFLKFVTIFFHRSGKVGQLWDLPLRSTTHWIDKSLLFFVGVEMVEPSLSALFSSSKKFLLWGFIEFSGKLVPPVGSVRALAKDKNIFYRTILVRMCSSYWSHICFSVGSSWSLRTSYCRVTGCLK